MHGTKQDQRSSVDAWGEKKPLRIAMDSQNIIPFTEVSYPVIILSYLQSCVSFFFLINSFKPFKAMKTLQWFFCQS